MFSKIAVTSLLAGAALANPFPPSILDYVPKPVPDTVDFSSPGPNYMPSNSKRAHASRTVAVMPAAAPELVSRETGETVSNGAIARFDNSNIEDGVGNGVDEYNLYLGDGSTNDGWPAQSSWVSFDNMFNNYKDQMFAACSNQEFPAADDSGPEVGAIYDGIMMAADASGVDHRFILAIIMQESHGCVRVTTTNNDVRNPGLMQDHDGSATCNDNNNVQNPCPSATIYQMISEGTAGTNSGDGLANCINESGGGSAADFYRAARIYNSGSIASSGQLQSGVATHCYASDIANRLVGWVNAGSNCNCDNDPSSCGVTS